MANLNYDDGLITLHVQGDPNRAFTFNPEDPKLFDGFLRLYQVAEAKAKEYLAKEEELKNVDGDEDLVKAFTALMLEIDEWIRGEMDALFGPGSAAVLFGKQACTATASNGDFIFFNMLNALYPYFEAGHKKHKVELDNVVKIKKESLGKRSAKTPKKP